MKIKALIDKGFKFTSEMNILNVLKNPLKHFSLQLIIRFLNMYYTPL